MDLDVLATYREQAIRFWERGRLWYLVALTVTCAVAITFLLMDGERLSCILRPELVVELAFCFVAANLCYSFCYVPEFLAMGTAPGVTFPRYRWVLWMLGTLLSMLLTFASMISLVRFTC